MTQILLTSGSVARVPDDVVSEDTRALKDLLTAVSGGDCVTVSRKRDGKMVHCGTLQSAAVQGDILDVVQANWGGGDYRLQIRGRGQSGKSVITGSYDVSIESRITPTIAIPPAANNSGGGWDMNKIAAAAPLVLECIRAAKDLFTPAQNQLPLQPYVNPTPNSGGGLAALSETVMTLQLMGQLKGVVNDTFGVASDNSGGGRHAMLQALAPAMGMLLQQQQQPQTPTPTPTPEQEQEYIVTNYEDACNLTAEAIRAGDIDGCIKVLANCTHEVSTKILQAPDWMVRAYAAKYGLDYEAVNEALQAARGSGLNEHTAGQQ